MSIERGDVYLARFPHASGTRGKRRPVVVVQADMYNQRLRHVVVVQLTTNLSEADFRLGRAMSDPSGLGGLCRAQALSSVFSQSDASVSCKVFRRPDDWWRGALLGEQGWRHGRYLLPGIIARQVKNLVKTGSFDR